jgi:hypothetical protein
MCIEGKSTMSLLELHDAVQTREDFIKFVGALAEDFEVNGSNPRIWENRTVDTYLGGVCSWVYDMDQVFKNRGEATPEPSWHLFATILFAAVRHE